MSLPNSILEKQKKAMEEAMAMYQKAHKHTQQTLSEPKQVQERVAPTQQAPKATTNLKEVTQLDPPSHHPNFSQHNEQPNNIPVSNMDVSSKTITVSNPTVERSTLIDTMIEIELPQSQKEEASNQQLLQASITQTTVPTSSTSATAESASTTTKSASATAEEKERITIIDPLVANTEIKGHFNTITPTPTGLKDQELETTLAKEYGDHADRIIKKTMEEHQGLFQNHTYKKDAEPKK